MTAGLNDSYTGSSYFGSDSLASGTYKVRKKNRKIKKCEVVLVKKHAVPSHSSACKNSTSMYQVPQVPATKKPKPSVVIPKTKNVTIKKKIKVSKKARPPNTELLLKQAKQIAGDTKNLHLLREAIVEFKSQRDQFVQSLSGLQKKLKDFQIPELFAHSASKMDKNDKDNTSSKDRLKKKGKDEKMDKTDDKGDRKTKKKKDVRSVSQHFYLADMTESEDSSTTSSSSSESTSSEDKDEVDEKKIADKKVRDFLEANLIPIQPPEKGRNLDRVNSLTKHNSPWAYKKPKSSTVDGKLSMLRKTLKEVSNKKIPVKVEASKQKSSFDPSIIDMGLLPSAEAAVQAAFNKLQIASEHHMQEELRDT